MNSPDGVMDQFPFYWVDAFSARPFAGNPCAVLLEAGVLDSRQMQTIALEMNLSETAFVTAIKESEIVARYFTPAEEIPMAGHPTIAVFCALAVHGALRAGKDQTYKLKLRGATLRIVVEDAAEGAVNVTMQQPEPKFLQQHDAEKVANAFSLTPTDLLPGCPIQTVSTGTPQLMVPIKSIPALRRAKLNLDAYLELKAGGDFFSPHLFVPEGISASGQTFARHFGVPPDTVEDPFTGSATGAMAAWLWHYGVLKSAEFVAEQGYWLGRPGAARVRVLGPREQPEGVQVSGQGIVLISGKMQIQE